MDPPTSANGTSNIRIEMAPPDDNTHNWLSVSPQQTDFLYNPSAGKSCFSSGYMQPLPKLENFFPGGESTGTQHSCLTQIYAPSTSLTNDDIKKFLEFQALSSANSSNEDALLLQSPSPVELVTTTIAPVADSESQSCCNTFGQRTSRYRGVSRHRWTGRYEAHLWDNTCRREGQARKGRQVYLGGYDKEEKAAKAYDLASLKYWGSSATTNFPVDSYAMELEEMKHLTKQEFLASIRRKSSGFSRGASVYRGVTRHHQQGRWQARIGRVAGNKDLYLGTFSTEEEAAEAYDIAAIKFRGVNAVTNFEMSRYDVEAIARRSLPLGGSTKRLRISIEAEQMLNLDASAPSSHSNSSSYKSFDESLAPFLHPNLVHHLWDSPIVAPWCIWPHQRE